MKKILGILVLGLLWCGSVSAGITDLFKSDNEFCMDKVMEEGTDAYYAAIVCSKPPAKSCMKRVMEEGTDAYYAAKACGNN